MAQVTFQTGDVVFLNGTDYVGIILPNYQYLRLPNPKDAVPSIEIVDYADREVIFDLIPVLIINKFEPEIKAIIVTASILMGTKLYLQISYLPLAKPK